MLYTGPDRDLAGRSRSTPSRSTAPATSTRSPRDYKPPVDTTPGAERDHEPSPAPPARRAVTLSWASCETGITGYGVQAYVDGDQGRRRGPRDDRQDADDQQPDRRHRVLLHRQGEERRRLRPRVDAVRPARPRRRVTDTVTIGTAKWKSGDFRVTGTGSLVGAIVTVRPATSTGTIDRTKSLGTAASRRRPSPRPREARTTSASATATPPRRTPARSSSSRTAAAWPARSWSRTASRTAPHQHRRTRGARRASGGPFGRSGPGRRDAPCRDLGRIVRAYDRAPRGICRCRRHHPTDARRRAGPDDDRAVHRSTHRAIDAPGRSRTCIPRLGGACSVH